MEKTIIIDGREVKFKATAATIRLYRKMIGRDFLVDMQSLQNSIHEVVGSEAPDKPEPKYLSAAALQLFEDIAFVMAKQAEPGIPDNADDWLDTFNIFSIYEVLPQVIELWELNTLTTSESKKKITE